MIFQDPSKYLNPAFRIGEQITETLVLHFHMDRKEAREQALEILRLVGMRKSRRVLRSYPHELSGGMKQRAMIAMAICCKPALLIADEPTTALDVTIQAQILSLLKKIREEFNAAIIIITHDLALAAQICTRVLVMYAGKIIEKAPVKIFYENPAHPYSNGLIRSVPVVGRRVDRLFSIEGQPPSLLNPPAGCRFAPRCEKAMDRCLTHYPPETALGKGHKVACWLCTGE